MFVDHAKLLSAFTWTSPTGGVYVPEGYLGEESATVSQVNTLWWMMLSLWGMFEMQRKQHQTSSSFSRHCVHEVYFPSFKMGVFCRLQQLVYSKCWHCYCFFCLSICIGCSRTALNIFADLYPHYLTTANLIKN